MADQPAGAPGLDESAPWDRTLESWNPILTLLLAVVGTRLVSATVNFTVNRRLVFGSTGPVRGAAMRYATCWPVPPRR